MKRFYEEASFAKHGKGFAIVLDGHKLKTPANEVLLLPRKKLAEAIAGEWASQGAEIHPSTMPLTRLVNNAIDRVEANRQKVVDELAKYAGSDLICYRAAAPDALVIRQAKLWDPLVRWAWEQYGADLIVTTGVIPVSQSPETLAALKAPVEALDPLALTGFAEMVTATGSLVIALGVMAGEINLDAAWAAASLDEKYQSEKWGDDPEMLQKLSQRRVALETGARLLELL